MWIKFNHENYVVYRLHGDLDDKIVSIEELPSGRMGTKLSARILEFNDGRKMLLTVDGREQFEVESLQEAITMVGLLSE